MNGPDIGSGENPEWTKAKRDAALLVDRGCRVYEMKSLGTRHRPDDPNFYAAMIDTVADALFKAQNGAGLDYLQSPPGGRVD